MGKLKYLVIHCTATPEGREVSGAEIRAWHTNPVSKGGRVYAGGCAKDGKTPADTRTSWQKKALEKYVKDFHRRFPDVRIVGHNELAAKACPSFDVQRWLKQIGITQ